MPKQMIKIKAGDKQELEIAAMVIGKFAYHPSTSYPDKEYVVTHIATGLRVADVRTAKAAREMARKLDNAVAQDITPDRIYSEEYRIFARAVQAVVGRGNERHD